MPWPLERSPGQGCLACAELGQVCDFSRGNGTVGSTDEFAPRSSSESLTEHPLRTTIMARPTTVDAYIAGSPRSARPLLRELRQLVRNEAPAAVERISYGMPTYDYRDQRLLHFAAAQRHLAVYA